MLSMMELGAGLATEGADMDAVYKCVEGIAYIFLSDATALEGDGASEQQPHYRKHHTHPKGEDIELERSCCGGCWLLSSSL